MDILSCPDLSLSSEVFCVYNRKSAFLFVHVSVSIYKILGPILGLLKVQGVLILGYLLNVLHRDLSLYQFEHNILYLS